MKKFTFKLLTVLLTCVILLPLIIACDKEDVSEPTEEEKFNALSEEEKAFYILNTEADTNQRAAIKVRLSLQNGSYQNRSVSASAFVETVNVDTEDRYFDYTKTVVSIKISQKFNSMLTAAQSETVVKTGWTDGSYFEYTKTSSGSGSEISKKCTPQTKEEYISKKKKLEEEATELSGLEMGDNFGITRENCSTATCVQLEDGTWKATFTDVNEECLAEFKKLAKAFEQFVKIDNIQDIILELTVTSDFKPISAKIIFGEAVTYNDYLSLTCQYAIGDDVVEPEIDLSEYN
ncbi:MAG: hypothetical protein IJ039_08610 [Clostridia bacterium]|nr:hypothetical protein [Clostridia bacterium]